jgi:ribosomal protein S8
MTLNKQKLFSILKNGFLNKKDKVLLPYSSNSIVLLERLRDEGFIRGFSPTSRKRKKLLEVLLKLGSTMELTVVSKVERRLKFKKSVMIHSNNFTVPLFSTNKKASYNNFGECLAIMR